MGCVLNTLLNGVGEAWSETSASSSPYLSSAVADSAIVGSSAPPRAVVGWHLFPVMTNTPGGLPSIPDRRNVDATSSSLFGVDDWIPRWSLDLLVGTTHPTYTRSSEGLNAEYGMSLRVCPRRHGEGYRR